MTVPAEPQAPESTYAAAVVRILREHFPDISDPNVAEILTQSVCQQARTPQNSFEFIVDDPYSAKWRLKAKPGRDHGRVRLRCYRVNRRQSDNDLEDAVNDALEALESAPVTPGSGSEETQ